MEDCMLLEGEMGWLVSTQWNVMTHTLTNGQ